MGIGDCHFNFSKNKGTILIGFEFNLQIKSRLVSTKRDFIYCYFKVYNSNAFLCSFSTSFQFSILSGWLINALYFFAELSSTTL